jgi:protease I
LWLVADPANDLNRREGAKIIMAISGRRVAILVENLYEDLEFWYPYYRLKEEGAEVTIVGTGSSNLYKGKHGLEAKPDITADQADPKKFDAVIIPGGYAPDYMRRYPKLLGFVKEMHSQGKPVAAICHAGWVLASAGLASGLTMTCFSSIKEDVVNAGAKYVDEPVVKDRNIITSRFPADLPAFCREIVSTLEAEKAPLSAAAKGLSF